MRHLAACITRLPRGVRFGIVGACAATAHFVFVTVLVAGPGLRPLVANVFAFLGAFCVSYSGHVLLTFQDRDTAPHQSLPRYFVVAVNGFICNELLYWFALKWLHLPYQPALVLVLLAVAAMTYLLSHFWAFRERG